MSNKPSMELRGSLRVSKYQNKPSQPRFFGKALINGVEYKIKGWEKETNGEPWISILFEAPEPLPLMSGPQAEPKVSLFSRDHANTRSTSAPDYNDQFDGDEFGPDRPF